MSVELLLFSLLSGQLNFYTLTFPPGRLNLYPVYLTSIVIVLVILIITSLCFTFSNRDQYNINKYADFYTPFFYLRFNFHSLGYECLKYNVVHKRLLKKKFQATKRLLQTPEAF